MEKIGCAVVGLGRIGSLLEKDSLREKPCTHTGAIIHNPECLLLGGCDILKEPQECFKAQWNCNNVFYSIDELLKFKGVGRKTANLVITLGFYIPKSV